MLSIISNKKITLLIGAIIGCLIGFLSIFPQGIVLILGMLGILFIIFFSVNKSLGRNVVIYYVFLTIFIPKSGIKISGLPITLSNIALGVALVASIVFYLNHKETLQYKTDLFVIKYLFLVIFFFGMLLILSFIEHDSIRTLIMFIPNILPIVTIFFIYHFFVDSKERITKVLILSSTLVVCYGTVQMIFGHYETIIPGITVNYTDYTQGDVFDGKNNMTVLGLKLVSTYQNGNLYGSVLIFIVLFMFGLLMQKGYQNKTKPLFLLISVLAIINLLATLSRSALIGFALGLIVLSFFVKKMRKYVILITMLGVYGIFHFGYHERIFAKDLTGAGRTQQYVNYINSFFDMDFFEKIRFLLIGKGYGFNYQIYNGSILQGVESGILNLILYSGIIGLVIYLIPLFYSFVRLTRWKNRDYNFIIAAAIFSSLVGMLGQISIDQLLNLTPTGQNYWILVSVLLLYIRDNQLHSQEPR